MDRDEALTGEKNLLDYLAVLVRWRWMILVSFVVVSLAAAGVSLILPKAYVARAVVLPPEAEPPSMRLSALLSKGPVSLTSLVRSATPAELFSTILRSRTVADSIVVQFNLEEVYGVPTREEAIHILGQHIEVRLSKEGSTTIEVEASTPELAADMANAFVAQLDAINRRQKSTMAGALRRFIGERLAQARQDLRGAETNLRDFQRQNMSVDLAEQTRVAIEGAAKLQAEIVAWEVTLGAAKRYMDDSNPQLIPIKSKIAELKKQLARMTSNDALSKIETVSAASASKVGSSGAELYVPFEHVPEVGMELARRMRELKIQEVVFEFLTEQYEEAKIEEARNTPTVQVLDRAVPPVFRSRPYRKMIVLVAGGLSLIVSIFLAFLFESLAHLLPEDRAKLREMKEMLQGDFRGWTRRGG